MRNIWKRIIAALSTVMIALTMFPALGGVQNIFAAGGTPKQDGDVYLIEDAQDFAAMAADGNYKLVNDIIVAAQYNGEFSGTFDGGGHTITLNLSGIAIGKTLRLSPPFPPLHTVHATFTAHGVPSSVFIRI